MNKIRIAQTFRRNILAFTFLSLLLFLANFTFAQIETFTADGTFTASDDVTSITVECWGGRGLLANSTLIINPKNSYTGTNEGPKILISSENTIHFCCMPSQGSQFGKSFYSAFAFINHINALGL